MIRAIFFKEFCKIRKFWLLVLFANIGVAFHLVITTRRLFLLDHPEIIWYRVVQLGQLYCEQLRYIPLATGIIIGLLQFVPEMYGERLRLGLHLPISPQRLMFAHLFAGLCAFSLAVLPNAVALYGITALWFPPKWPGVLFFTVLPWFFAGIAAYFGSTLVILEPALRLKACNALIAAGVCRWYLMDVSPGAYQPEIFLLCLPLLLMIFAVLHPAFHFRTRRTT